MAGDQEKAPRCFEQDGFRVCLDPQSGAEQLLSWLLPDPDRVLAAGEVFKPGSRTHGVRVELGGQSYFLKRYNCRGPLYRLRNAVRRSRARKTWSNTRAFRARGVPVPLPFAMLEERRFRLLGRSYILMDFVAGSESLRSLWPRLDARSRSELLSDLGGILGRMHRSGCLHGDLKWDNILVCRNGGSVRIQLIDLDGSRVLKAGRRTCAERDLDRFLLDLERTGRGEGRATLMDAWLRELDRP